MMKSLIFYGAGKYAEDNISRWTRAGLLPVRFADSNIEKHGLTLSGYEIYSLDYAISQYPEYDLYLSVGVDLLGRVTEYLINERGIPRERIKYFDAVEMRQGCKFIGTRIQFFGDKFGTCCKSSVVVIPYSENFEENIKNYNRFIMGLISKLRFGDMSVCEDCAQLRYDLWPVNPRLEVVGFDTAFKENKCNFNCIYCGVKKSLEDEIHQLSLIDMMRNFEQFCGEGNLSIVLASGEISIMPERDKVFEIIKENHWNVHVFTNASVFSQELAELIHLGFAKIQVSMDAGTATTFAKIKGIDCYNKVVANLRRYSNEIQSTGLIELKFILLPGVNDNESDVNGFIELAEQLKADVVISSDNRIVEKPLPEKTLDYALKLCKMCQQFKIQFNLTTEFFHPETYQKLTEALS